MMGLRLKNILPFLWFAVMPFVFSTSVGYQLYEYVSSNEMTLGSYVILYVVASIAMGTGLLPTTFMAVLTGFLGGWKLLPFMIVSYLVASVFGYFIGSMTNKGFWQVLISSFKKGKDVLRRIDDMSRLFIFSCRLSPVLPFGLTNIALATIGVRLKEFLLYGSLGMLPRTVLAIWLGIEVENFASAIESGSDLPFFQIVTVVLVFLSSGLIIKLLFGKNKQENVKG